MSVSSLEGLRLALVVLQGCKRPKEEMLYLGLAKWRERGLQYCCALIFAAAGLAAFTGQAVAQEFTVRNFPLPISIDGEHVRSNIFLQFEMKNYGTAFSKFAAAKLDPREAMFADLVRGIQGNNPKSIEKFFMPPRPKKVNPDEKGGVISSPPMTPAQAAADVIAVYRSAFGNFENVNIIAQVLVGSRSLFIWDANMPGRPRRRAFAVESEGQPARLVAREVIGSPVDTLILSIFEDGVKDPAAYAAVADPHLRYRQPLAIEGKNKTQHEIALLFNGEPMDFDAYGETPVSNPLLAFYRKVFTAFKAHKQDEFLAGHSPKSQAKLKAWWKTFDKDAEAGYYSTMLTGRWVKFVMDGDPVYLVFYSLNKGNTWVPGSLSYQYVVRNPQTQQYLISNVMSEGFFDDVIGKNDLFDQRVMKSVSTQPKAPATPPKSPAAPPKPAAPKKAANGK
jgi:hypothetical protein